LQKALTMTILKISGEQLHKKYNYLTTIVNAHQNSIKVNNYIKIFKGTFMTHAAIFFDTFQYAKDLQKAGYTEVQIETQVKYAKVQIDLTKEQTNTINELIDNDLVTKKDLKQEIKELELKMEKMNYNTIIILGSVLGGMIMTGITVLGYLIKT